MVEYRETTMAQQPCLRNEGTTLGSTAGTACGHTFVMAAAPMRSCQCDMSDSSVALEKRSVRILFHTESLAPGGRPGGRRVFWAHWGLSLGWRTG